LLGKTEAEYLVGLEMWIDAEDDVDGLRPGLEYFARIDRCDFVCSLNAEFFLEALGEDDGSKHTLGRGVVVIVGSFSPVLKFLNRDIPREGGLVGENATGREALSQDHAEGQESH